MSYNASNCNDYNEYNDHNKFNAMSYNLEYKLIRKLWKWAAVLKFNKYHDCPTS